MPQCRLVLWVVLVLMFPVSQQEGRGSMNTRVCAVYFYYAETPLVSIKQPLITRDYDLREHISVPHDNLFQSILSFASSCGSPNSRSHDRAANAQRSSRRVHLNPKLKI